jgi:thiol-disulfide isomerase/thioredoxin
MKRLFCTLVLLLGLGVANAPEALSAEKAICLVCKVKGGEAEEEVVKAWVTHEGVRHGFCSKECAKEFEADPAAYLPPAFPRPAPELAVSDLSGKPLTWSAMKGRVVLVDFWATWCTPCRKSMPELQALHDKYADRGFSVVGVSIDDGKTAGKVKKFVASKKITYPIAIDSEKAGAWERFRVKAVPAAFLVDQEGRIVAQWTGIPADVGELEKKLGSLLARAD